MKIYNIGVYTRISKEDKLKKISESILNQKNIIELFINNNFELKNSNIFYYSDDGVSGVNFEREGIKALLNDINNGKINCIIVKDLSRFGRDYIQVGEYLDKIFPKLNVRFISINDNYDSQYYNHLELEIGFKNIIYSYYSKDNSKKIKSSKKIGAEQGKYVFGAVPFGYKKSNDKTKLEINGETAGIVKYIFQLAYSGKSNSEICRILNEKCIPTREYFKTKLKNNKKWRRHSIYDILSNEVYIGNTVYFKHKTDEIGSRKFIKNNEENIFKYENTHKAIISKEIFYYVNNRNNKKINNKKNRIFSYKLKCGICGYSLKSCKVKNNNIKYYCNSFTTDLNNNCPKSYLLEDKIKEIILYIIKIKIKLFFELNNNLQLNKINLEINNLNKKLDNIKYDKYNLYEKYSLKEIGEEDYIKEKQLLKILENNIKSRINNIYNDLGNFKNIQTQDIILEKHCIHIELTKKIVDFLIDKIFLLKNNSIKIVWKFKDI